MAGTKKQTADARKPPRRQRTGAHGGVKGLGAADDPDAKLPHELDESPGNAADAPRGEGHEAYEDAKRGMPDTDRGPVLDETYRKQRK
jgi:hypothetical protein